MITQENLTAAAANPFPAVGDGLDHLMLKLLNASATYQGSIAKTGTLPGLLVVGQSLSDGFGANDYTTPASGKHLMFNGGTRALHDTTLDVNKISSLVPLVESVSGSSGQTCLTSALDYMTQLVSEKLGIPVTGQPSWIGATMARSGQPISSFPSGQYPYTNSVAAAASMLRHASAAGKTGGMKAIFWMQGESNNTGAGERATYKTALEALITSYLAGTGATVFCGYQTAGGMTSNLECLGSTLAQWDSFKEGNYNIVTPNYFMPDNASVHINATGQGWMGAYLGRWLFDYFWRGVTRKPLYPTAVTRDGTLVTLTFAGNEGQIVLDTDNYYPVTDAATKVKLGFSMLDGSTPVDIGTPVVVGTNQVTFTCPASFVGTPTVRYAIDYRGTEWNRPPRGSGNLRDSSPDRFTFRGYSLPLHNWAVHFDWAL